jgi:hypothetical protein
MDAHCTKRPNIVQRYSIDATDQPTHQPVAKACLGWNSPNFSILANTRSYDQISVTFNDWGKHGWQIDGIVAPIAIHKNDDVGT